MPKSRSAAQEWAQKRNGVKASLTAAVGLLTWLQKHRGEYIEPDVYNELLLARGFLAKALSAWSSLTYEEFRESLKTIELEEDEAQPPINVDAFLIWLANQTK